MSDCCFNAQHSGKQSAVTRALAKACRKLSPKQNRGKFAGEAKCHFWQKEKRRSQFEGEKENNRVRKDRCRRTPMVFKCFLFRRAACAIKRDLLSNFEKSKKRP